MSGQHIVIVGTLHDDGMVSSRSWPVTEAFASELADRLGEPTAEAVTDAADMAEIAASMPGTLLCDFDSPGPAV